MESLEGTIYIDDVDINQIGIDILTKNITIIPKDLCLMEGTLKYNINQFNKTKDGDIISILKNIGFEYTESDDHILHGGSNLSAGEKQLICIARTTSRKTKIVLIEEDRPNIDMKTE